MSDCCHTEGHDHGHKKRFDFILWGSTAVILLAIAAVKYVQYDYTITDTNPQLWFRIETFGYTVIEFLQTMWWGVVLGIIFVGLMAKIPKEYFNAILGRGDTVGGILRAALGGLLLDLCSHGILMIGAKLYERGASTAQVMTFLIASPWNSLSLTLILIALIGLKWTLLFMALSAVIAIITGIVFMLLVKKGVLPDNPNTVDMPENFSVIEDAKKQLKGFRPNLKFFTDIVKNSRHEAQMLLRWLLLGVVLASAMRALIPPEHFADWFGPSMAGLALTLVATTLIEVCSEGSSPIAAEIMNQANAPGNAFTFLMAGVSTDYTEIMILKDTTKSWKIALFLPLITVPQILVLGYILNMAA